jgi:Sec7-like guanine-nucleotide exchange factor
MPGEGQKVDRMMEKFGEKFNKDNPETFGNSDCIYLLSYATIMLQTTIHNPQASKHKMTLDDFIKILRGVNAGKDLEREFVISIYE